MPYSLRPLRQQGFSISWVASKFKEQGSSREVGITRKQETGLPNEAGFPRSRLSLNAEVPYLHMKEGSSP